VLPEPSIPNLELRVREFKPSSSFDPYTSWSTFHDQLGWLPSRTACTRPYAIPYTDYVGCGKLEIWAKESLRWKLERYKNSAGRSLLSTLGREGKKVFRNVSFRLNFRPLTRRSTPAFLEQTHRCCLHFHGTKLGCDKPNFCKSRQGRHHDRKKCASSNPLQIPKTSKP
jgi:hypothetical protein